MVHNNNQVNFTGGTFPAFNGIIDTANSTGAQLNPQVFTTPPNFSQPDDSFLPAVRTLNNSGGLLGNGKQLAGYTINQLNMLEAVKIAQGGQLTPEQQEQEEKLLLLQVWAGEKDFNRENHRLYLTKVPDTDTSGPNQ